MYRECVGKWGMEKEQGERIH